MRINNIHSKNQFYNHIFPFRGRWVNYRPVSNHRNVIFTYMGNTYRIECNPLTIEDNIRDFIINGEQSE